MEESKQESKLDPKHVFKLDELIELFGGAEKYYSMNQIMYVYLSQFGESDETAHYLRLCHQESQKLNEKYSILKTEEEIKNISGEYINDV